MISGTPSSQCASFFLKVSILGLCALIGVVSAIAAVPGESATGAPLVHAKFARITTDDGLSNADVRAIAQDQEGFMWFGTTVGGINRYDGYEFREYQHNSANPGSPSYNFIWALYVDKQGTLWAGTNGGGLDRYDRKTDSFDHFRNDPKRADSVPNNTVLSMLEDRAGRFWVGTRGGISLMDRKTGSFLTYRQTPTASMVNINSIRCMIEDPKTGIIWLGTSDALCAFDPETGNFQNYLVRSQGTAGAAVNAVNCIVLDGEGTVWTMTEVGLRRFRPNLTSIPGPPSGPIYPVVETFTHDPNDPRSLSSSFLRWGIIDRKGRIWIASQHGLNVLDPKTRKFTRIFRIPGDPESLADNTVHKVFEDRLGTIWISSIYGGVSRLRSEDKEFTVYRKLPEDPNSLVQDSVTSLWITRDGILWAGTSEGLSSFDGVRWTRYRHNPRDPHSLSSDSVTTLGEDSQGRLWVGTYNAGLNILDGKGFLNPVRLEGDTRPTGRSNPYSGLQVNSFFADSKGGMWIGARAYGLDYFDGTTFLHYPPVLDDGSRVPSDMAVLGTMDEEGGLWYGTEQQGLIRFDPRSESYQKFLVDSTNPDSELNKGMYSITNDGKGSLWICCSNGLLRFDLNRKAFIKRYSKNNGLPADSVGGMLRDASGCFWLSTPAGLVRFDPEKESFRLFDKGDGLPSNQFSIRAAAKASDGKLYFGSVAGVVSFYPDKLKDNQVPPNVVITGFELFDKSVVPGAEDSPLKEAIGTTQSIQLRHDQSVFSLKFAALDFTSPVKNRYAYRMDGFDEHWRYTSAARRLASYTNLPPGNYVFRVRATNNDGEWSQKDATLAIVITPPWWETAWFRILVAFGLVGGFVGAFGWRVYRVQQRNIELTEQIEVRRRIEETLRASEERFRALYDDNPAVYLTIDIGGVILSVNRFGADMIGCPPGDLIGHSVFGIIHSDDEPLFQRHFDQCLRNPGATQRWEQRIQRKDGCVLWVRPSARALARADGSHVVLLVCEDITEKVSLETHLRQVQKMEALGQLAGGVAHDFNNILTIILTQTAWVESEDSTPEEKSEAIREVREAARRAANLTRQLLVFSRRETVKRSTVDLNDVIAGIAKMIRRLIGEHIVLRTSFSPQPARILADSGMIEQVLVNMAVNARDAMPNGGDLSISTKVVMLAEKERKTKAKSTSGEYLCLEITDTGCGISPEILPKIFEPFYTTKPVGKGTGLGLATSLGIIQQHEGWIDVESKPGEGSTFSIYLPRLNEEVKARQSSESGNPFFSSGQVILLVEDDPIVRKSARLVLERSGYLVHEASDGDAALLVWKEHKDAIQMLMSDIVMPGELNGRTLALTLLKEKPALKVGLMSGYDPGMVDANGETDAKLPMPLQKPVTTKELLAYVRKRLL